MLSALFGGEMDMIKKNVSSKFKLVLYLGMIFLFPLLVQAHLIGGNGFASGIIHPVLGFDHLLAMVAVGIISIQLGGRALLAIPSAFVLFLVIGGLVAIVGLPFPAVELGISLSVLVLGVFIALSGKIPTPYSLACVALFALFHGHAHGTEMPLIANPILYATGFVVSTAVLHISGIAIGHYAAKTELTSRFLRYAGVGMGLIGIMLLAGL
jgi:urease accessory protein